MKDLNDAKLVRRTLTGDDLAFETLVGRYQSAVFSWVRRTLPDTPYDQDLAQEVFIEAYFNLDTLRAPCKFKGWLKQITRNVCVSWLRRQKQVVSYEQLIGTDELYQQIEVVQTPEALLMSEETFADLRDSLHCLSEANQQLVQLYYFEGLSYQQISRIVGISVSAIKSRLHRARAQLKEALKGVQGNE